MRITGEHEGTCAHDGRHECAAGGRRGFDSSGEPRSESRFFHHRNGDHTDRDGIGNRRAGHGTHQPGTHHRDQAGTTHESARQAIRQAHNEIPGARLQQKGAENDEHEYEGRRNIGGKAKHALTGKVTPVHDRFKAQSRECEHPTNITP